MDDDILRQLNEIFTMMNNSECSDEDRMKSELFLNDFIQNPNSIFIFIQFLLNESNPQYSDYYACAALKRWVKSYWNSISEVEQNDIIGKLTPLIFSTKKISSLIRIIFYSKITDPSYLPLWNDIFVRCQAELQLGNESIEKVSIVIENVFNLSQLIKRISINKPVDQVFLVQFNEITAPFFNPEMLNSPIELTILLNSIKIIQNLFGRSLVTSSNEFVDLRIYEMCVFLLKIYEFFSSNQINQDHLNFLTNCSSQICQIVSCVASRQDKKHPPTQYLQMIRNEWQPVMLDTIFNLCLFLFRQDPSEHFKIGKIIQPLMNVNKPISNIDAFIVPALDMIAISQDDLSDFLHFPDLFYQYQYCSTYTSSGNLRNYTVLIYRSIFENLNFQQISFIFQNVLQVCESNAFLVAKSAKVFIKKRAKNYVIQFFELTFTYLIKTLDQIFLSTVIFLSSKCVQILPLNHITQVTQFALKCIERYKVNPYLKVPIILCVRFLYKLKKEIKKCCDGHNGDDELTWNDEVVTVDGLKSVFPDEIILPILLNLLEFHITNNIFKLIEMIADDHEEVFSHLVNLREPLLNMIINEMINYQEDENDLMFEKSQLELMSMFSLLMKIISRSSDIGIEDQLFKMLSISMRMSNTFDITDDVFKAISILIKSRSIKSELYLREILSIINNEDGSLNENLFFVSRLLNYSVPFVIFMSLFPTEFVSNGLLFLTYQTLVKLMNCNEIKDKFDDFGLVVLLTWIFQLQPQIISPVKNDDLLDPSFFLSYLETRNEVCESSIFNMIVTFALIDKIALTPDVLQRWFDFIQSRKFIRLVDVHFHMLALRFFIRNGVFMINGSNENEVANLAISLVQELDANPNSFVHEVIKSVANDIRMLNIEYPLVPNLLQ